MINQCSVCGINDAKVEKIKMVVFTAALAAQKIIELFYYPKHPFTAA